MCYVSVCRNDHDTTFSASSSEGATIGDTVIVIGEDMSHRSRRERRLIRLTLLANREFILRHNGRFRNKQAR